MHELAKTLPPPRKQNTACDACRARKVKCNRIPGNDKHQHCLSKDYPCTNFVQQETAKKRHRKPRSQSVSTIGAFSHLSGPTPHSFSATGPSTTFLAQSIQPHRCVYPSVSREASVTSVLAYIFSPPTPTTTVGGILSSPYDDWGVEAHKLNDEGFRKELALDLVEVYFQIVHTRFPLLNPEDFRSRFHGTTKRSDPLHPALVATVVAWGAKFAENTLFVADRQRNGGTKSLFAIALVDRARELAELLKVHRISSPEHVIISLLLEPLQSQNPEDPIYYHRFWLTSAVRSLLNLQINHKSVMSNIQDSEDRGIMIFAWWMAVLADGYSSTYFRKKPMLDDDDYDIDFYTAAPVAALDPLETQKLTSNREHLEFLGYYRANHALARIARQISKLFWKPLIEIDGIPMDTLQMVMEHLYDWKATFLQLVGVSGGLKGDFIGAISACASDATYHVMWVIVFDAVDDFGIKEMNDLTRNHNSDLGPPQTPTHMDEVKVRVFDEALRGASRIAGLIGVLESHQYLRLDPAAMLAPCLHSGFLLARLGRPEVQSCISGLQQYSYAYEEAADQANEMARIYNAGGEELSHMAGLGIHGRTVSLSPSTPRSETNGGSYL
ncbi:hypothetical protein BDM02DRAFT_3163392 [Thelephora ganbajun]|uniref:Uncharacterized protein n=1 Tax=Thelephora ganbajun TaxID=370292 RepID=A0ACB6ZPH8_THEGA|nr:hypothetical protein BDM02DRAFT_3163392 [Thelephora ganbajun]